jgi:alpha-beta hydrolase superfamily lysophospholipase
VQQACVSFAQGAHAEQFDVRASDGVLLRGWRLPAAQPNGAWVLLFHGLADNRMGVVEHARVLLRAGYSVTLPDAHAHGESGGKIATYGWLECRDTGAIIDHACRSRTSHALFCLGRMCGRGHRPAIRSS